MFFCHQKQEGTASLITLSPTLVDPALVSVIRAVDGQDTGLSAQPAEQPTSDRHRPGLSSSERTGPGFSVFKASADRPAQKNATFDVISSQPMACPSDQITKLVTCFHRPGRSEVRSSELPSTVIPVPGPVFTNMDQAERKISSRSDQDQGKWLS